MPATPPVHDKLEVPEPLVIDETLSVQLRFVELEAAIRLTVPAKPFNGEIVIVDPPPTPAFFVRLVGFVAIVKSWTANVIVAEWDRLPLVPVTAT